MKNLLIVLLLGFCLNPFYSHAQVGPGGNEEPNQCISGPKQMSILGTATFTADNFCNAPAAGQAFFWQISGPVQIIAGSVYSSQITVEASPGASVGDVIKICLSYFCEGYCGDCCVLLELTGLGGTGEPGGCPELEKCDYIAEPCDEPIHEFCFVPPTDRADWSYYGNLTVTSYTPSAIPNAGCQNTTPPFVGQVIPANSPPPLLGVNIFGAPSANGVRAVFNMIENCAGGLGLLDGESITYDIEICMQHKIFPSLICCDQMTNIKYTNFTCDDVPCNDGNFPQNTPWLYNAEYDCANGPGGLGGGEGVKANHDFNNRFSVFEFNTALDAPTPMTVRLSDLNGRLMLEQAIDAGANTVRIAYPDLPSGIYLITLVSQKQALLYTEKIFIE